MNESLSRCVDCGKQISLRALTCPGCGAPNDIAIIQSEIDTRKDEEEVRKTEEYFDKYRKWSAASGKAVLAFVMCTAIGSIGVWASYDFEQWEQAAGFLAASALLAFIGIPAKLARNAGLSNIAGVTCGALWGYVTFQAISSNTDWPTWALWSCTIAIGLFAYGTIGGEQPPEIE